MSNNNPLFLRHFIWGWFVTQKIDNGNIHHPAFHIFPLFIFFCIVSATFWVNQAVVTRPGNTSQASMLGWCSSVIGKERCIHSNIITHFYLGLGHRCEEIGDVLSWVSRRAGIGGHFFVKKFLNWAFKEECLYKNFFLKNVNCFN